MYLLGVVSSELAEDQKCQSIKVRVCSPSSQTPT